MHRSNRKSRFQLNGRSLLSLFVGCGTGKRSLDSQYNFSAKQKYNLCITYPILICLVSGCISNYCYYYYLAACCFASLRCNNASVSPVRFINTNTHTDIQTNKQTCLLTHVRIYQYWNCGRSYSDCVSEVQRLGGMFVVV